MRPRDRQHYARQFRLRPRGLLSLIRAANIDAGPSAAVREGFWMRNLGFLARENGSEPRMT